MVSIRRAAVLLGVAEPTIRKWLRERRLPFHRCGRRIVLRREDLEAFLQANRVETANDRTRP
jgi:excisionase family DNA binding protein